MSTRAVIVWLFLAVLLGLIALWLLVFKDAPSGLANVVPVGDRVFVFPPGEVSLITVERPGEPREVIQKPANGKGILGSDADWELRLDPAAGAGAAQPAAPWPLKPASMSALLRVLTEARAQAIPAKDASLGKAIHVTLTIAGKEHTILLADRPLAGTVLAEVTSPDTDGRATTKRAVVADAIQAAFTSPGPLAWRDDFPAGGIAPDASRIRLERASDKLVLAKLEGRWSLQEPAAAAADPASVQRLIADLARVQIADFMDSGPGPTASAALEKPMATITVEADRRTVEPGKAEPKVTTDTLTLTIGGSADAGASKLFASVNGLRTLELSSRSVLPIKADPALYVWPHPLRMVPSDIGFVSIAMNNPAGSGTITRTFKRPEGRWLQVVGETEIALAGTEQQDVEALLAFLTGEKMDASKGSSSSAAGPARADVTLKQPDTFTVLGALTVSDLMGRPLPPIQVASASSTQWCLHSGPAYLLYTRDQVPALLRNAAAALPTR